MTYRNVRLPAGILASGFVEVVNSRKKGEEVCKIEVTVVCPTGGEERRGRHRGT
jgi:hypothetical protein